MLVSIGRLILELFGDDQPRDSKAKGIGCVVFAGIALLALIIGMVFLVEILQLLVGGAAPPPMEMDD
jgi:hypothetical protein